MAHTSLLARAPLGVLMSGALMAGALLSADPTAAARTQAPPSVQALTQVSVDPYTQPPGQHRTQVEPDSFSNGNTIVMTTQSGRIFDGGATSNTFARSTNGGATWTSGQLPGLTTANGGPFARASDPVVAFSALHNVWMIGSLGINAQGTPTAVVVSRSTNGGASFGTPVTVATSNQFPDKNWTACDNWPSSPFFGRCYTEWDNNSQGNRIQMSTSTNGGATWGPALSTATQATGLGGMPTPLPNGNVIVPIGSANLGAIRSFRSLNGGANWRRPVTVTNVTAHNVAGSLRDPTILSADVDASGRVYVVWHDCRFRSGCPANDIVMTTTTDGINWTPVVRIPIDPVSSGVDHFIPGLAVNHSTSGGSAQLALTYYFYPQANCSGDGCELRTGFVSSNNGGATWSAPQDLTGTFMRPSWIANTSQGRMVGDYISTSFVSGGVARPIFSFATAPTGGSFNQHIFTADLTVTGGAVPADETLPIEVPSQSVDSTEPSRADAVTTY